MDKRTSEMEVYTQGLPLTPRRKDIRQRATRRMSAEDVTPSEMTVPIKTNAVRCWEALGGVSPAAETERRGRPPGRGGRDGEFTSDGDGSPSCRMEAAGGGLRSTAWTYQ